MPDILIADDHPLFRDALTRAVRDSIAHARVHGATSVNELLALAEATTDAELLLLDLHIPGARGFSALVHIRRHYPALPTIVISAHEQASVARRALAHGAAAYVPKSASVADIREAIRAVLDGDIWLPRTFPAPDVVLDTGEADAASRIATLTPQQFRVMSMVADGKLNKQIAWEVGVSEATVKAHMTAIMRKLGVGNRTQVALLASTLEVSEEYLSEQLPDDAG